MNYFIGIDIGTSRTKAVVVKDDGQVVYETSVSYGTEQPMPGWVEQRPDDLLEAVITVLGNSMPVIPVDEAFITVCFSAAMHSMIAVNEDGHPVTNLWTWADTRSESIARKIKDSGDAKRLYKKTGTPIHPMSLLCKIAWLRKNQREVFDQAHRFISGKEYVLYQLFGEWVVDYSLASASGLFDIHKMRWSKLALDVAGIEKERLSRPVSPLHELHPLRLIHRDRLPLPGGIQFIVGASDGCLANIGTGAVDEQQLALTIGTSGAIRKLQGRPINDPGQRLFNYRMDDDSYLVGGAINNGGNLLKWFYNTFTDGDKPFEDYIIELMKLAALVPVGAEDLLFLPYVYGERAPVWDAAASGIFVGIRSHHTRAHFLRALMEGVAFSILQILDAIEENEEPVENIYASGGFIASPVWTRIMSDVLNKKLSISHEADASALGAVFMAMRDKNLISDWHEVKQWVKTDEILTPTPANLKKYRAVYAQYKKLYQRNRE